MPKVGDVVAGKYEIERVIGEGGMGAVFSAMHKLTGRRVALKWMLPELARDADAVQRFMREAQAAGRIDHPNVVDVYDVGQHEDSFFLVMEFLNGEPLTAALERRDLSAGEAIDLMLPAIRGVAAAHRGGVVHRDLKPDNIFLCRDEDGRARIAKVLDFGISKLSSADGQADMRLTKTGAVVGTPYYMSPEQIRGSHQVDKRSDVYAFGVILYEALTGSVPFNAETYSALILEIATGTVKDPRELAPSLPEGLAKLVLKAMARDLNERYPDMESLAQALEPFAHTPVLRGERRDPSGVQAVPIVTGLGGPTTPFVSEAPVVPRNTGSTRAILAVVVLLLLGGIGWLLSRGQSSTDTDTHVVTPAPASATPVTAAVAPAPPAPAPQPMAAEPAPAPAALPIAAPPRPAAPQLAAEPPSQDATHGRHHGHKERVAARAQPADNQGSPPPAPAPHAAGGRSARSGTLSVGDF